MISARLHIQWLHAYHGLELALKLMYLVLRLTKHVYHLLFMFGKLVCIVIFKVLELRGMDIIGTIKIILQFSIFTFEVLLLNQ